MCVRALSHAGAEGSARNYHWGRAESAVLDKTLLSKDSVVLREEEGQLMAACPSTGAPPAASSPGTSLVEVEWAEKRTELSLGEQKETKEDAEEGQKVPGSWKIVRREGHDWKSPKDFKHGWRFSLQF